MKKSLKSILVYLLISYTVLTVFQEGLQLPDNPLYLIAVLLIISLTLMIVCPLLNFLTVKCKFFPFLLMSLLLLVGVFYAFNMFMVGFLIETYTFKGYELGTLQVNKFEVIPVISMILYSFFISLFASIYKELDVNKAS